MVLDYFARSVGQGIIMLLAYIPSGHGKAVRWVDQDQFYWLGTVVVRSNG